MALVDPNDIFFTPFEPKLKNRFIMNIDGIPAFLVKTMARPAVQFETVTLDHINTKRYVYNTTLFLISLYLLLS